jgi:hypothetical protein
MPPYRITLPGKNSKVVEIHADNPNEAVQRAVGLFDRRSGERLSFSVYEIGKLDPAASARRGSPRVRPKALKDLRNRDCKFIGSIEMTCP